MAGELTWVCQEPICIELRIILSGLEIFWSSSCSGLKSAIELTLLITELFRLARIDVDDFSCDLSFKLKLLGEARGDGDPKLIGD